MSRPSKLTPELAKTVCKIIAAGNHRRCAAQAVGIAPSTLQEWIAKGRNGEPGFVEFSEQVAQADASAEMGAVAELRQGMLKNYQAALAWLERMRPDWRLPDKGNEELIGRLRKRLTPEECQKVSDALIADIEEAAATGAGASSRPRPEH